MFYVYILYSEKLDSFYKGQTGNLKERIKRHNLGYERSTKNGVPWEIIWYTTKANRSEAIQLERKLKNLGYQRTKDFISKFGRRS